MNIFSFNFFFFVNFILPIFSRVLGIIYIAPIFGENNISFKIKMVFSLILTFFFYSYLSYVPINLNSCFGILVILNEFFIGLYIGLTFRLFFIVVNFAGDLIGTQMGLSLFSCIDMNNNAILPLLSKLLNCFTYLIFFITNAHLWIIAFLAQSFNKIPIGSFLFKDKFLTLVFFFGNIFSQGLILFFPIVLLLLILNLLILFLNRIILSVFFFSLGFSLNFLFGMCFLYIFFITFTYNIMFFLKKIIYFLLNFI